MISIVEYSIIDANNKALASLGVAKKTKLLVMFVAGLCMCALAFVGDAQTPILRSYAVRSTAIACPQAFPKYAGLARFSLERNRSSEKKSRKINKLERILVAKVCQLLRNSL